MDCVRFAKVQLLVGQLLEIMQVIITKASTVAPTLLIPGGNRTVLASWEVSLQVFCFPILPKFLVGMTFPLPLTHNDLMGHLVFSDFMAVAIPCCPLTWQLWHLRNLKVMPAFQQQSSALSL